MHPLIAASLLKRLADMPQRARGFRSFVKILHRRLLLAPRSPAGTVHSHAPSVGNIHKLTASRRSLLHLHIPPANIAFNRRSSSAVLRAPQTASRNGICSLCSRMTPQIDIHQIRPSVLHLSDNSSSRVYPTNLTRVVDM